MDYVKTRIDRILLDELGPLYNSGFNGESAYLWNVLKDKCPLKINADGNPDIHRWCTQIYKMLPDATKIKQNKWGGGYYSYTSAAREQEPLAVMVSTLKRWLERNPSVMAEKLELDNPKPSSSTFAWPSR